MKKTYLILISLLVATTAFAKGYLQDADFKSLSDLQGQTPPAGAPQLLNTTKIYDVTNSKQLSQSIADGDLGGAGAGGGGVVLNANSGFEKTTTSWTASGGTFTTTTTAANVGFGARAGSWDASAAAQTLSNDAVTVPAGLFGKTCSLSWYYKGGDANLKAQVFDGSNVIAESSAFTAQTTFSSKQVMFFTCPSSGTIQARFIASSNAAIVYLDDVKLGQEVSPGASINGHVGTTNFPFNASCQDWVQAPAVGTYSSFPVDNDCSPTSTGRLSNPATNKPAFTIPDARAGVRYRIRASGFFYNAASSQYCSYRFASGSDASFGEALGATNGTAVSGGSLSGEIVFASSGSKEVEIQVAATNGAPTCYIYGNNNPLGLHFTVDALSSVEGSETVSVDQMGWKVSGNIGGFDASMGTSSLASYTEITNNLLDMVLDADSAAARVTCSGTNPSTGLTCAAGDESIGFTTSVPTAGEYTACFSFGHLAFPQASGSIAVVFQAVETADNAQTVLQEGKQRVQSGSASGGSATLLALPQTVCGDFNFSSAGQKTIRLMREQLISGGVNTNSILADRDFSHGQRDIRFKMFKKNEFQDAVKFTNLVTTPRQLGLKTIFAVVTSTCSASPCSIAHQSGGFTEITRSSTGVYTADTGTTFANIPFCTATEISDTATSAGGSATGLTANNFPFTTQNGTTLTDTAFTVFCTGW